MRSSFRKYLQTLLFIGNQDRKETSLFLSLPEIFVFVLDLSSSPLFAFPDADENVQEEDQEEEEEEEDGGDGKNLRPLVSYYCTEIRSHANLEGGKMKRKEDMSSHQPL